MLGQCRRIFIIIARDAMNEPQRVNLAAFNVARSAMSPCHNIYLTRSLPFMK